VAYSPVFATALADGTALVASGTELRVVMRDGDIVQSLHIPGPDTFVTPPAPAGDGTVWIATNQASIALTDPEPAARPHLQYHCAYFFSRQHSRRNR